MFKKVLAVIGTVITAVAIAIGAMAVVDYSTTAMAEADFRSEVDKFVKELEAKGIEIDPAEVVEYESVIVEQLWEEAYIWENVIG